MVYIVRSELRKDVKKILPVRIMKDACNYI